MSADEQNEQQRFAEAEMIYAQALRGLAKLRQWLDAVKPETPMSSERLAKLRDVCARIGGAL